MLTRWKNRENSGAVVMYSLATPSSPVLLCYYEDTSTYYTGMSVSVTVVSSAPYVLFGSPYNTHGQVGLIPLSSTTATSANVYFDTFSSGYAFIGQTVAMMPGSLFGVAASSYGGSSSSNCVLVVMTVTSSSITGGTPWNAPDTCT